jgi:hypothetical protein
MTSEEIRVLADYFAESDAPTAVEGRTLPWDDAMMSVDDVLAFRELTALADELADPVPAPGMRTLALRPARLSALRDSVERFVESRDDAEWIREEDREPLARVRGLLLPLEELGAEALRAALSPTPRHC